MTSEQWQATILSLQVATTCTIVSFPFAVVIALLLSKSRGIFRLALDTLVNLPLVMPPVVTGYLLLVTFGRRGIPGRFLYQNFGIEFIFDFKGAVLAAAIVAFPLIVRSIRLAFDSVNPKLIQTANSLGASPWKSFWTVKFPLSLGGLAAGCLLAFARSLGEFGATIMVAGSISGETKTIPLFIYEQLQSPGGINNCWPVIVLSILIAMLALVVSAQFEKTPGAHE